MNPFPEILDPPLYMRKVFGMIGLELWLSWQHKAPIDLQWEKL